MRIPIIVFAALAGLTWGAIEGTGGVHPRTVAAVSFANVRVTHDRYSAHVEPSIAANPRNSRNLVAAALLFAGSTGPRIGTFASFNGGRTWHDNGPLSLPTGTSSSDVPDVAFDNRGRVFVIGIAENAAEIDFGSDRHTCVCLWQSADGGHSFRRPVIVQRGQAVDHPSIAVSSSGAGIYVVWRSKRPDGISFSRSIDGGGSFSKPRVIAVVPGGEAFAPAIAADDQGWLAVVFDGQKNPSGRGKSSPRPARQGVNSIEIVTSTDSGTHFSPPSRINKAPESIVPVKGASVLSLPSIATARNGRVTYVSYMDGISPSTGIVLSRSSDGGHTWHTSTIARSSPDAGTSAFQPSVVAGGAGNVLVSYLTVRREHIDLWVARSRDRGGTFPSILRITTASFNPALGLHRGRSWWIGDYQGMAMGGGMVHPIWSDTRTGRLEIFSAALEMR